MHIFGYGETQVTGRDDNGKVANSSLTSLPDFSDYLSGLKKGDGKITLENVHTINILNGEFILIGLKSGEKLERIYWADINQSEVHKVLHETNYQINASSTHIANFLRKKEEMMRKTSDVAPSIPDEVANEEMQEVTSTDKATRVNSTKQKPKAAPKAKGGKK